MVLLALVGADYEFLYIDVGCNGRVSDGGVFKNSSLYTALEREALGVPGSTCLPGSQISLPHCILADDAFPLKTYIMKPFAQKGLTLEKRIFNYSLSRARRLSENAFGILASRFRVFMKPICLEPAKVVSVVLASCALHNLMRKKSSTKRLYTPPGSLDAENSESREVVNGEWRIDEEPQGLIPFEKVHNGKQSYNAKECRDMFAQYFVSDAGQVPWQIKMI